MKLQPEIIAHDTIPPALHGINPRTIEGKQWWDVVRKKVYAENDYKCWACGCPSEKSGKRKSLDAHECYIIDYKIAKVTFKEVVGLCTYCHNFVHSQRLHVLYKKLIITQEDALFVLNHGYEVLGDIPSSYSSRYVYYSVLGFEENMAHNACERDGYIRPEYAPWSSWKLLYKGVYHYPKFKNEEEWKSHYDVVS